MGRTDRLIGLEIQPLQMPVVIYSITKAKCPVYFYDCQLYQVSISTTTYTIYFFSEYIYYTYAIFVIGKDLLFDSASRLMNKNKIHCKCCFRQGLAICILNNIYRLVYLWHTCVNMFYFRLNRTRIDDVSLAHLGNILSSNSTFRSLAYVIMFSYTKN